MCVTMNQKKCLIRHFRIVLMILLTLICLGGVLSGPSAHATGVVQVTFTVRQLFTNNSLSAPPSEVFTYQLLPQTPNAPMPLNSDMHAYSFSIIGTHDVDIGPISFNEPGLYVYTLICTTDHMPGYIQNRKIYTIEVYISNEPEASIVFLGDNAKAEELAFEHIYDSQPDKSNPGDDRTPGKQPPTVAGPKTGDFSNPTLWIILIAVSSILLMFIILIGRRISLSNKQAGGQ